MKLKVYDGEYFERSKLRYLSFWAINVILIVLGFIYENIRWAILQIALLGGYFYMQMKSSLIVDLELQEIGVQVGKRLFSYEQLRGFVIEADAKTKTPQNLLLLTEKDHHTYTFADTPEQIQKCVGLLLEHIPYVEEYQQSMLDKFIKKIKI